MNVGQIVRVAGSLALTGVALCLAGILAYNLGQYHHLSFSLDGIAYDSRLGIISKAAIVAAVLTCLTISRKRQAS